MRLVVTILFALFANSILAYDTVRVESSIQFINSIASNRVIYLTPSKYELSGMDKSNVVDSAAATHVEFGEDGSIIIKGVKNLEIFGAGNEPKDVTLSSYLRSAYVLAFYGCANVEIINLTAEHSDQGIDEYEGGIWSFNQCSRMTVSNNKLRKGKVGIRASRCKEITVKDSKIDHCSNGIVELIDSWTIRFGNCTFSENIGCSSFWYMTGCMDVLVENSVFEENTFKVSRNCRSSKLISITRSEMVFFKNNIICPKNF